MAKWSWNAKTEILTQQGKTINDVLWGTKVTDKLYGNSGNDRLHGMAGDDLLAGGLGSDILIGGPGRDVFRFDVGPSDHSVDTILDFEAVDRIELSASAFAGIGSAGVLEAGKFALGPITKDTSKDVRIVLDSHALLYDFGWRRTRRRSGDRHNHLRGRRFHHQREPFREPLSRHLGTGGAAALSLVDILDLFGLAKYALRQGRLHEGVEVAVEHVLRGCRLRAGAQVLDHLVGLQHVGADLVPPADLGLRGGSRRWPSPRASSARPRRAARAACSRPWRGSCAASAPAGRRRRCRSGCG